MPPKHLGSRDYNGVSSSSWSQELAFALQGRGGRLHSMTQRGLRLVVPEERVEVLHSLKMCATVQLELAGSLAMTACLAYAAQRSILCLESIYLG